MKTVLCYGDSLTWGYDAESLSRHALADRWPTALAGGLGDGFSVIAEGLNGRTTAYDDHGAHPDRNGARVLPTILGTHEPIDLVVLFLGTNDLKVNTGGGRAFEARMGMERLVEIVRTFPFWPIFPKPEILIVAPPVFRTTDNEVFTDLFSHGIEQSRLIAPAYAAIAAEHGCRFFDAASVAETTPVDGIHLDAANTRAIGKALVDEVRAILAS